MSPHSVISQGMLDVFGPDTYTAINDSYKSKSGE